MGLVANSAGNYTWNAPESKGGHWRHEKSTRIHSTDVLFEDDEGLKHLFSNVQSGRNTFGRWAVAGWSWFEKIFCLPLVGELIVFGNILPIKVMCTDACSVISPAGWQVKELNPTSPTSFYRLRNGSVDESRSVSAKFVSKPFIGQVVKRWRGNVQWVSDSSRTNPNHWQTEQSGANFKGVRRESLLWSQSNWTVKR